MSNKGSDYISQNFPSWQFLKDWDHDIARLGLLKWIQGLFVTLLMARILGGGQSVIFFVAILILGPCLLY